MKGAQEGKCSKQAACISLSSPAMTCSLKKTSGWEALPVTACHFNVSFDCEGQKIHFCLYKTIKIEK